MPEFDNNSSLKKRERELVKLEKALKYFSFFYTKDHQVNLKRISIFAITFILFFYLFRFLILNNFMHFFYNLVLIITTLYLIAFFLVTTRYENDLRMINEFRKHIEDIRPTHNDKVEELANKLLKKR